MFAIICALLGQPDSTDVIITTAIDTTTTTTGVAATGSIDNKPVIMPKSTNSLDSNKVSQKRNSTEHISPDSLTKDAPSGCITTTTIIPHKPQPKPNKLRPITNTENQEISYSVLSDSTSRTAGNTDKVNTCQSIPEDSLPIPHTPLASEQFAIHDEESTDAPGNFQSNILY